MNKKELISALEALGMRPGRGLGQNFLLDGNLLEWIARKGGAADDEQVLEVGPGFGALTEKLLFAGARVTAVEFDHRLVEYLLKKFSGNKKLRLISADACRVDYASLFPVGTHYRSIANLPYAISSVFIARLLESANPPDSMLFMLQREMGERLAATPECKAYGALSVRCQLLYQVKIEKIVPPDVFCPPPEVESALVSFKKLENPLCNAEELKMVTGIVKTAFSQRRKQLGKVLGHTYGKAETEAVFQELQLPLEIRPDKLSVADFAALAGRYCQLKSSQGKKNGNENATDL